MALSREQVLHIAELAKLSLTDDEAALYAEQLSEILAYAERLNALDTGSISPMAQAIMQRNVLREDVVGPSLAADDALANAPRRRDGFFLVNPILG
jgi:aspartyl-tRNA(Asn)/glutamyl-tRNA(Gln) amidotransferase subunit C